MTDLMVKVEFWVAMIFAITVKLRASPKLTLTQTIVTVLVSLTGALLFTEPVYTYFGFTGDTGKFACCALVALTCEDLTRKLMAMSLKDLLDLWRGKSP